MKILSSLSIKEVAGREKELRNRGWYMYTIPPTPTITWGMGINRGNETATMLEFDLDDENDRMILSQFLADPKKGIGILSDLATLLETSQ